MSQNTETTVYVIELRDRFTMGMNSMNAATDRFNNATAKAKYQADILTRGFNMVRYAAAAAATYGIGRFIKSMTDLSGKFEETQTAFSVMMGDKGMGKSLMDWAKEFSRTTIVTFEQTVTSMRKLMAYGLSGDNSKPLTKMLGTIAAGVGQDRLPYLTLALGQVFSRGRLMGTELRQFREHGVDIVSEIAKGLNKKTSEVEKMVTQGLIPFDMVVKAMMSMTEEGGRFHGMLEETAKTWNGMRAIFKSTWDIFLATMGDILVPILKITVRHLTELTDKLARMDWSGFAGLIGAFSDSFRRLGEVFSSRSWARIAYESALEITYIFASMFSKITTEVEIFKNSLMLLGDALSNIGLGMELIAKGEWGLGAKMIQNAFNNPQSAHEAFRDSMRNQEGRRQHRLQMDYLRQLNEANKKFAPKELNTGEFVSQGNGAGEDGEIESLKKKTNRTIGTGARDIIINIGNLMNVEEQTFMTKNLGTDVEQIRTQLTRALLTVVNDTTQMIR